MKLTCKKNLFKSTYGENVFIKGKQYEIIEYFRSFQKSKMCVVKSDKILGNGGMDFSVYGEETFYALNDYFYTKKELREKKLKRIIKRNED